MLTENVRIHCLGFHPSEKTEEHLTEWAEELQAEAPAGACLKVILSRHGREYHSEVRITSRAGMFHAMNRGPNLYTVMRDSMKRIRRQFEKWQTLRRHAHYAEKDYELQQPQTQAF